MDPPSSYEHNSANCPRSYNVHSTEKIVDASFGPPRRIAANARNDHPNRKGSFTGFARSSSCIPRNALVVDLTDDMDEESHPSPGASASNSGDMPTPESMNVSSSPGLISPATKRPQESIEIEQVEAGSKKRSSRERSQDDCTITESGAKRRKHEEAAPVQRKAPTPSPTPEPLFLASPVSTPFFDDAPKQLLQRSCALVLDHVGFDGASKEAMEAFSSEVDIYMTKLISYATESMHAARRSQPTPPDFEFAMRHMGLTSRLLKPHLKPPVAVSKTQLILEPDVNEDNLPQTPAILLGKELSGDPDKKAKKYIPRSFPAFPSKHTYKSTSVVPDRENDPRKIREKATQAARNAEEALRRLVKVGKTGTQGMKRGLENDKLKKTRNELWGKSMAIFSKEQPDADENTVSVDSEKRFWRRPVMRNGKHPGNGA